MATAHNRALIALGDDGLRLRVAAAASEAGIEFEMAGGLPQALESWALHQADMVVTGELPDAAGGVQLIRELRAKAASFAMPMILFVGAGETSWTVAHAAGADQCLSADSSVSLIAAAIAAAARRVRTDLALHRAEAMAEAVSDGVVTIDSKGIVRWANSAASRMFGYGRHELLGRDVGILAAEPHRGTHASYVRRYTESGVRHVLGQCVELPGRRKDGSLFPLELTVSEIRDGATSLFIGVLRDISQRKAAQEELAEKAERLERLQALNETGNEFAREVVERLLRGHGQDDPLVHRHVAPADDFSGDVVAALRSPAGKLYVMLADATGHGLAAAISLLPAISVFHGMAARSLPLAKIVGEMNAKLRSSMPVGRFVAAAIACIDPAHRSGEVWVGGTPDLLWLDTEGQLVQRFASSKLALGIVDTSPLYAQPETFEWDRAGQLFACSDGVLEARDAKGEPFAQARLLATLAASPSGQRIAAVREALGAHIDRGIQTDDISLLCIDLPA